MPLGDLVGVPLGRRPDQSFIEPSNDVVMECARLALAREGRDRKVESEIWTFDSTGPPILSQGRKNYYEITDDIPKHVTPFYSWEYYQQREYFRSQRDQKPLKERLRNYLGFLLGLSVIGGVVVVSRIWIDQPKEISMLRTELLQQTYGRVLELAAGHGSNIGTYPYQVHEIVMCDSNAQALQSLRYRIPKTAYPKYEVRKMRSEFLEDFADAEFDCVVDMFGICHLRDPVMALRQMQRVVKPTGMILLLEHGRSEYPPVNWVLDYFQKSHQVNTHGCRWNLPISEFIKDSRLQVKELKNMHYGTTYFVVAYPEVLDDAVKKVERDMLAVA